MADAAQALDYDLLIAGGGMVGASLALICATSCPSWRIALVEANPYPVGGYQPSFDARHTALSAGSAALFETLGFASDILSRATAINAVHVSDQGYFPGQKLQAPKGESSTGDDSKKDENPLGYVVPNAWLGRVLWAQLAGLPGVTVLEGRISELQRLSTRTRACLMTDDQPRWLEASLVAIADGAHSTLRQTLGITLDEKIYGQRAIIANVRSSRPHGGIAYERFGQSGPLALLPLGVREQALIWTLPESIATELLALGPQDFLQRLQRQFGYRLGRFEQVGERESYPLSMRLAREQVRPGLVLMGNAAHFFHPVAGQGFNLALRDCAALVSALSKGAVAGYPPGDLAVLDAYTRAQAVDQRLTRQVADGLIGLFGARDFLSTTVRHSGLLALDLLPPVKQQFHRQMAGLAGPDYLHPALITERRCS